MKQNTKTNALDSKIDDLLKGQPLKPSEDFTQRVLAAAEADAVWSRYLTVWTRWNHARTIACTLACGLFIAAIVALARASGGAPSALTTGGMLLG